jgi:phospholipid/cholesterol/gamma-HCH transport system substrate-binding protein
MAQRRSVAWTELRVGILVITSFALLALGIFFIGGSSGFLTPKYTVFAYFENANNLKAGAEVQLEGVTIGNVRKVSIAMSPDPKKAVEVEMRLEQRYRNIIRTDSMLTIGTIGLLGDKFVDIGRGTEDGQVVQDGGYLQGSEAGDIAKIVQGTNDFVANLQALSDQFKRMTERIDRGEGTLGKLLTDSAIFDNINRATIEANGFVRDLRTGNGTVGKLVSDDELYRRVNMMVERMDRLVGQIEHGQGTASKFINDPAVYHKTDQILGKMEAITDRIDRGEGTLGKLAKDEALYNDLREAMKQFQTLVASVQNGEGSAGKFISDPTLYNSINQTSSEVLKLLYDFRQNPKKFLTINFKLF